MLLRSVYLKTLRDARVAIAGWGLGIGLMLYTVLIAYTDVIATPAARAALAGVARDFSWLAAPIAVDTPGGYALFKYGPLVLLVSLWPLLACSRILRGEEETGVLDVLLSAPRSRLRVALEKLGAVGTALLLIAVIVGVLTYVGGRQVGADFTFGDALALGLDLALFAALMGAVSLLLSQFTRERRTATGIAGALLLVFVVLDMVHRVYSGVEWVSRLSPVYYFNESKPLVPSYGTSVGGLLVLLAATLVLTAAALALFARRDVGGTVRVPFVRERQAQASTELAQGWSLRSVYARTLSRAAWPTFWWTLGIAGFAGWLVAIVDQLQSQIGQLARGSPAMAQLLIKLGGGGNLSTALLSSLFTFLPLMLMAFAITQSNRWTTDEDEGRLELVLTTPQERPRVMLASYAALTTAIVVIAAVTLAVTLGVAAAAGVHLDVAHLVAAALTMIPLGLLVAALGYFLSGWLRTAIDTGLLSLVVVAWFLISFVGPELKWPEVTLRASPFYYYGTPLVHGAAFGDVFGLVVTAAVVLALGVLRFSRKDVPI
jgi:polyether ionophore transport system permease protein